MKIRSDFYILLVVILILLTFLVLALRLEYHSMKIVPLIVVSLTLSMAIIELVGIAVTYAKPKSQASDGEMTRLPQVRPNWHKYLFIGSWGTGLYVAFYILGIVFTIPLAIFSYMVAMGTKWWMAMTYSLLTAACIYTIFEVALEVYLYRGLLFS